MTSRIRTLAAASLLVSPAFLAAQPSLSTTLGDQMRIDLANVSVTPSGSAWNIVAPMLDDNEDTSLPNNFRRWWHFQIDGLNATEGETLNFQITNAGYSDVFTPVWSFDGGTTYERVPGVLPSHSGGVHSFTIEVPPGHASIRLSKFYPYTLSMYDAFRASIVGSPFVTEEVIGQSVQGRDIYMHTLTDSSVSDVGKRRVWIHSAVHPSENTAYFNCEGLIEWLISGNPEPNELMRHTIFNIVTMANPDGVALGNYRTNANSVNLENQWSFPYDSTVPEIVALRTKIEEFMGTASEPGQNPILILLNLHATHGHSLPFHFIHVPTYNIDGWGVIPEVRALQDIWVAALRDRNAFYAQRASDPTSNLAGNQRPFVESMVHDRYTLEPQWDPIMAVTFEGVYQGGPTPGVPGTDDDWREMGRDMGFAVADFFEIDLTATSIGDTWVLY